MYKKIMMTATTGLFLFVMGAVTVNAKTMYVNINGASCPKVRYSTGLTDPGAGTQANPYCFITTASNNSASGDTINVAAGTYKEKVTLRGGSSPVQLTGTVTCTNGSTTISGSGTTFTTQVSVGDFIRCRSAGAGSVGNGYRWAEVASIASNTSLTLKTAYVGVSTTGTADYAKFTKWVGDPANPDSVRIDAYDSKPSGLSLQKLSGYQNIWYYDTNDVNATGAWKKPEGFHENRGDTNYYTTAAENGADPYLLAADNQCPWGSGVTALQGMDKVAGTYTKIGTLVYVHIRSHGDPNTIDLQASSNPEYSAMLTAGGNIVVDGFSAWGGLKHTQRNKAMNRSMFLGGSNALYKNLKAYNGMIYVDGSNGLNDTTFKNVRSFWGLTPPLSPTGSQGFSGLLMEDIEARGAISNVASTDQIWGVSADDRVIFRNWYIHAGTAGKEGGSCGGSPTWYDWQTDTFLDGAYEGPHGLYIGSQAQDWKIDHLVIENSIFEMNYDGLGVYSGQNSSDIIIRNNIFGLGGNSSERLLFGSQHPGTVTVRNNIFYRENYKNRDDWDNNGAIWTYGTNSYLNSNNNLFLHPTISGTRGVNKIPNVRELYMTDARNEGRELNSIEVSSGSNYFVDGSVLDGTPSNYHLLAGSPAINAGDSSNCPATDRDGNARTDGRCDIGPYEYAGSGGPSDTTPPSNPTNLSATAVSTSQINLTWTASTDNVGVTGYKILRSATSGGSYSQIGTTVGTSYQDTGLSANTTYYYVVQAYDAGGNTSGNSNQASATTQGSSSDTQAPTVPTNLAATAISATQINLSWSPSTDNVGVTGYNIRRSTTNGGPYTQIDTTVNTSYSDTGLAANTTYYYVVQAYDAGGNTSGNSNQASATTQGNPPSDTQPPSVPTLLSANAVSISQIDLSWTASTDNVGVTGYNIRRSTTNGGPYSKIGTSVSTTYSDTGLTANTTYYYVVQAYDAMNNTSGDSNQASATTQTPPADTTPPVISNVKSSNITQNSATITWTTNEISDSVTHYGLSTSALNQSSYDLANVISHKLILNNLTPGTKYYYDVQSTDPAGNRKIDNNNGSYYTFTTQSSTSETSFTTRLWAFPSKGKAPLKNVDLMAYVYDKANGATYTYTFYCNRKDPGLDVTRDYVYQVSTTSKVYSLADICTYSKVGNYLAKVIVTKVTKAAEWRTPVTVSGATVKGIMVRDLKRGSNGADVRTVQQKLIKLGYLPAQPGATGYYGSLTEHAIRAFQEDHGLLVSSADQDRAGIFDSATRQKLDDIAM